LVYRSENFAAGYTSFSYTVHSVCSSGNLIGYLTTLQHQGSLLGLHSHDTEGVRATRKKDEAPAYVSDMRRRPPPWPCALSRRHASLRPLPSFANCSRLAPPPRPCALSRHRAPLHPAPPRPPEPTAPDVAPPRPPSPAAPARCRRALCSPVVPDAEAPRATSCSTARRPTFARHALPWPPALSGERNE
jgi:hypothetical protein